MVIVAVVVLAHPTGVKVTVYVPPELVLKLTKPDPRLMFNPDGVAEYSPVPVQELVGGTLLNAEQYGPP